jgi:hypothetical protein
VLFFMSHQHAADGVGRTSTQIEANESAFMPATRHASGRSPRRQSAIHRAECFSRRMSPAHRGHRWLQFGGACRADDRTAGAPAIGLDGRSQRLQIDLQGVVHRRGAESSPRPSSPTAFCIEECALAGIEHHLVAPRSDPGGADRVGLCVMSHARQIRLDAEQRWSAGRWPQPGSPAWP